MKKEDKKQLVIFIAAMAALYVLVSFSVWDLNAKNWDIAVRILYTVIGTPLAFGISCISRI